MLAERFGACAVAEKLTRHNCTCSEAFQVPLRRAGNGSSKSLMPNVRLRSAEAKIPKLATCISPQSCTVSPLLVMD
jgi:hypothetical protein